MPAFPLEANQSTLNMSHFLIDSTAQPIKKVTQTIFFSTILEMSDISQSAQFVSQEKHFGGSRCDKRNFQGDQV